MARLSQLQIAFDPEQDRLLLRVNTDERTEFRFWLTRRLVARLWPLLTRVLESDQQVATQPDPVARQAVFSFQQERALAGSDFETAYRDEPAQLPMGKEPLLVTRVKVRPGQGRVGLLLGRAAGEGVELALTNSLLHSLRKMLADAVAKAEWSVALTASPQAQGVDPGSSPDRLN
jgi:hypothetical protein